jgi:hypothetical protein
MLVAKLRFDDGTKKVNGITQAYEVGEEYKGKNPPKDLVVDEKDYKIAQKEAEESKKSLDFVLQENKELRAQVDKLEKELKKTKKAK